MVWFTADFHLGHSNIIRYCGRPFASASEMDEEILACVNESVKPEDELYFLGDFASADRRRWLIGRGFGASGSTSYWGIMTA